LLDSAHIAEFESKHIGEGVKQLYDEEDVRTVLDYIEPCELNKKIIINENVSIEMLKNPHIVGSVQVLLYFTTPSNMVKKVLITGDIGNLKFKKHYVSEMDYCKSANITFIESTYGKNNKIVTKKERKDDLETIKNAVNEYIYKTKSRILIPVFGQDRLQVIMTALYELFKDDEHFKVDVVIDSKLGIDVCNVYKKVLEGENLELFQEVMAWDRFKFIKDGNESSACATDMTSKIILSTSGFGDAGRITSHLKSVLPNEKDCIIFCGYASPQSTSGKIRNAETTKLKIGNNFVKKSCNVKLLTSFSSHVQQDDIIKYMKSIACEKIVLVHGDKDAKNDLRDKSVDELRKIGKTTNIIYGEKDMVIYI
jgi:metallo-beta-lactamase family protein